MNNSEPNENNEERLKICIPGMRLSVSNHTTFSGTGTYVLKGYIYSCIAGALQTKIDPITKTKIISIKSLKSPSVLPKPGDIVTARVTSVNSRLVQCQILCAGYNVLVRPYKGLIKKEEIKLLDKDRVDPYKCFRPGDIILARVLPMTELHCYHLTTAENELGVATATAEGSPQEVHMIPISWSEMQCPKTLVKEPRKVARIMPEVVTQEFVNAKNEEANLCK